MSQRVGLAILAIVLCFIAIHGYGEYKYHRGRIDKNAEMMQAVTGDPKARIAIMSKNILTYHPAGICATCHGG